jgi:hypothetical protein
VLKELQAEGAAMAFSFHCDGVSGKFRRMRWEERRTREEGTEDKKGKG